MAVDTWHEHVAYTGSFTIETTYTPPRAAVDGAALHPEWLADGRTLLFEQYVRNLNSTTFSAIVRDHVLPIPLLAQDSESKATELGKIAGQPHFIYINPPKRVERLRHDMQQGWRLLACGGSLFGAGYHLFQEEIDSFEGRLGEGQPRLETHVVHAPGAMKFENTSFPYSDDMMIANAKSNFSTWALRGKRCLT